MNIRKLLGRKAEPPQAHTVTNEQLEQMTTEELADLVIRELPKYSGIFATFGAPSAWPSFGMFDAVQKEQVTSLYEQWAAGAFDLIPGVTPPPSKASPLIAKQPPMTA